MSNAKSTAKSTNRFRYGYCLNQEECTKAKNKEIQSIPLRKDFICEECGRDLRECPPPKKKKSKGLGIIASAAALLLLLGGYYLFFNKSKDTRIPVSSILLEFSEMIVTVADERDLVAKTLPEDATDKDITWTTSDSTVVSVDEYGHIIGQGEGKAIITATSGNASAQCVVTVIPMDDEGPGCFIEEEVAEKPVIKEKPAAKPQANNYKLSWGTYEGPMKNGVPHGIQGEVTVTSRYTIDLKKTPAQTVQVSPGDKIVNCKFENGRLVYGMLKRSNGEQEALTIGG